MTDTKIRDEHLNITKLGGISYSWPTNNGDPNFVLATDGSGNLTWVEQGGGGGTGLTALGGLTASAQFFGNDTNIQISSSVATHTIVWAGTLAVARGGTGGSSSTGSGAVVLATSPTFPADVLIKGPHPWIDVMAYGVLPANSGATNSTNIATAIAALPDGGLLYFPPGAYNFTSAIAVTSKAVAIRGAGVGVTELSFVGCNGIYIDTSATNETYQRHCTVEDMSIRCGSNGGGGGYTKGQGYTGITYVGRFHAALNDSAGKFQNLKIDSLDKNTNYWDTGIRIINAHGVGINNCVICGKWQSGDNLTGWPAASTMWRGISVEGHSVGVGISSGIIRQTKYGIYVDVAANLIGLTEQADINAANASEKVEGIDFLNSSMVVVDYGAYWVGTASDTERSIGFSASGSHIDSMSGAVYTNQVRENQIANCLFYKYTTSTQNYVGVYFANGVYPRIHNTMVRAPAGSSGTGQGILLDTCAKSTVTGCIITDMATCAINLTAGSNNCVVVGNTGNSNGLNVNNDGTGNVVEHNPFG